MDDDDMYADQLAVMSEKQIDLYRLMCDISEEHYCAGWRCDNEYILWKMVADPTADRWYGMREVDSEDIEDLRTLSSMIGGWIRWRDIEEDASLPWGPVYTPMKEWLEMYERYMAKLDKPLS